MSPFLLVIYLVVGNSYMMNKSLEALTSEYYKQKDEIKTRMSPFFQHCIIVLISFWPLDPSAKK